MRIPLLGLYGIDKKVLEQEYRRNSLRALGLLVSVHTHRDAYQTTYIHTEMHTRLHTYTQRCIPDYIHTYTQSPESTEEGKFQESYKPLFLEWFCFT